MQKNGNCKSLAKEYEKCCAKHFSNLERGDDIVTSLDLTVYLL